MADWVGLGMACGVYMCLYRPVACICVYTDLWRVYVFCIQTGL